MKKQSNFECMECGKKIKGVAQAEKGCPKCGGNDVDVAADMAMDVRPPKHPMQDLVEGNDFNPEEVLRAKREQNARDEMAEMAQEEEWASDMALDQDPPKEKEKNNPWAKLPKVDAPHDWAKEKREEPLPWDVRGALEETMPVGEVFMYSPDFCKDLVSQGIAKVSWLALGNYLANNHFKGMEVTDRKLASLGIERADGMTIDKVASLTDKADVLFTLPEAWTEKHAVMQGFLKVYMLKKLAGYKKSNLNTNVILRLEDAEFDLNVEWGFSGADPSVGIFTDDVDWYQAVSGTRNGEVLSDNELTYINESVHFERSIENQLLESLPGLLKDLKEDYEAGYADAEEAKREDWI